MNPATGMILELIPKVECVSNLIISPGAKRFMPMQSKKLKHIIMVSFTVVLMGLLLINKNVG